MSDYDYYTGEPFDRDERDDEIVMHACSECWYGACAPSCSCGCHREGPR